jgi:acyl-coenzyme A thioesterase PaaI-like protein
MAVLPVVPHVLDDTAAVRVGAIATLMDVAGASVALDSVLPDRTATVELAYQSAQPAREGPLFAIARALRAGSKQVMIDVELRGGHGSDDPAHARPLGAGTMTFSRLPQRADHAPIRISDAARAATGRSSMALPGCGLDRPLLEQSGIRVLDAARGELELDNHDWVRNSFGTLNGGMVAILLERAGELAARAAAGARLGVCDLTVHYLGQTAKGPARTRTQIVRASGDHAVCRVELRDTSANDALVALGVVTAVRR